MGEDNYCHMLMENNKYLAAITTIPIKGIDDDMLELTIIPLTAKILQTKCPSAIYFYPTPGACRLNQPRLLVEF